MPPNKIAGNKIEGMTPLDFQEFYRPDKCSDAYQVRASGCNIEISMGRFRDDEQQIQPYLYFLLKGGVSDESNIGVVEKLLGADRDGLFFVYDNDYLGSIYAYGEIEKPLLNIARMGSIFEGLIRMALKHEQALNLDTSKIRQTEWVALLTQAKEQLGNNLEA